LKTLIRSILFAVLAVTFTASGQEADLLVEKTGPDEAAAGADVAYAITLRNLGPDSAAEVTLSDPLPGGMTFVSLTHEDGEVLSCTTPAIGDPGTVTCTAASLGAGAFSTYTLVARIPPTTPPGTFFVNVASGSSGTFDPNDENNSGIATTSTPPPPQADLSVVKDGPARSAADSDVTYTIAMTNGGPVDAENVTLSDTLPGTMTFVSLEQTGGPALSCSTPAVGSGGTITCTIATFAAGETATFTLVGHIPPQTTSGTAFENRVTVSGSSLDPNEENNSGQSTLFVSSVDVSLTKSGPQTVNAAETISYTITITNAGPDFAEFVELVDEIPANSTFTSLTQNSGPSANCLQPAAGGTGSVHCTIGLLTVDTPAVFTLVVTAGTSGDVVNTATVTTASFDTDPSNQEGSVTTTISPLADLAVTKNGPAAAAAGENVTYTITLTNNGPSAASTVSLTDTLPANTTLVSFTQNSGPAFSCAATTCSIATFGSGATATFTLVARVAPSATGTIENSVGATTSTTDPGAANNTATFPTTLSSSADVSVTKSGPASAFAGEQVTYTITVTNNGPSDAASVFVNDAMPADTALVSFTQSSGPPFSCTGATCSIATLPSGATATFTLVGQVGPSASGTVENTATVTSSTADPNGANNSSTVPTIISASANLAVTKSGPASATPGTQILYTIGLTNLGPSNATSVSLTDTLPANTTFLSFTANDGPGFFCSGTTCTADNLNAGSTVSFTLIVQIDPSASGTITNTATATSATADPNGANNTATAPTVLNASADLTVTKSGPPTATPGANVTYTLTVGNGGPSDAVNVTLSDTLPAQTTFVSLTQNSGPAFNCSGPACTIASLPFTGLATFTLTAAVSPGATGTLENSATVSSATPDPSAANNSSTTTTTLAPRADLAVTKSGPAAATAGQNVSYTITVANDGPSVATAVTLADALPANTTFVSFAQNSGATFSCTTPPVGVNGNVTCTIASLAPSTATFTLVINISPAASGTLANTATVSSTTPDPLPFDNSSTAPTTIGANADLAVEKTGPATAIAGSTVSYDVTVTNAGPSDAVSVTLTDAIPAGATFVSATQNSGPAFSCTNATCTIASLTAGATATFTFTFMVDATTVAPITNSATVSSTTPDPIPANNGDSVTTAVAPGPTDLRITKSASATTALPQSNVTYTVVVTNDGPSTAVDTVVTDILPAGTTLISSTATQGSCSGTTTVTCTVGELAPGASATIELLVRVPSTPGTISNTATVTAANAETDPGDNASTVGVAIANPEAIPTLSTWMLIGLAVMLGVAAMYVQRT
jgi:uncharacterized repeat protein (TIGR01451 family)